MIANDARGAGGEPTRETLAPLLLQRFELLAPLVILGAVTIGALHVLFDKPHLPLLLTMTASQVATVLGGLWLARARPTRTVIIACALPVTWLLNAGTAVTGILIDNVHVSSLLYISMALVNAIFVPWGVAAQTACVAGASASAVAPLLAGSHGDMVIWYDLTGLAVAFAASIYIARQVERDTLADYRAQAAVQALAESRADFEGVFRSSGVLLGLFELRDDDFVYAELNASLSAALGHRVETLRGRTAREAGFPEDEIRRFRDVLARAAAEESVVVPEFPLSMAGPPRWYQLGFTAVHGSGGGPARISGVGIDVTDLRQAHAALQGLNVDLEKQVQDRTALLEAANKDLESFAYSVSHDLRTPLRTIEGFAALLDDDHGSELSPEARVQLDRIRGASQHMGQLINDILVLSRASRAEMRREPVDVSLLVRRLAAELQADRPERNIEVSVEPGLFANADPHLLRIVFVNLLENAWKYSEGRAPARIEVGATVRDDEPAYFVRDNGCGFDMRFVGKLFQPFQRLHAVDEFEGTGIGLATVARIVRRHGGTVWAEGEVDRGATFGFTLGEAGALNPS